VTNIIDAVVLYGQLVVDESTLSLFPEATTATKILADVLSPTEFNRVDVIEHAAQASIDILKSLSLGVLCHLPLRGKCSLDDVPDAYMKYGLAVADEFAHLLGFDATANKGTETVSKLADLNSSKKPWQQEHFLLTNLFRYVCYLSIAHELNVPYLPSPLCATMLNARRLLRRQEVLNYIEKHTQLELVRQLAAVTHDVISFQVPMLTKFLLPKAMSFPELIYQAHDLSQSKPARMFREFSEDLDYAIEKRDTKSLRSLLSHIQKPIDEYWAVGESQHHRKLTLSLFGVGTEFEFPDPFRKLGAKLKKGPLTLIEEILVEL